MDRTCAETTVKWRPIASARHQQAWRSLSSNPAYPRRSRRIGPDPGEAGSEKPWLLKVRERRHANVVAVALANKNARIAWSLLTSSMDYDQRLNCQLKPKHAKNPGHQATRGFPPAIATIGSDGETVTPSLPEPGVWTGMAGANALGALRGKRAKIHRGSRQDFFRPHCEAGYTSAVVTKSQSRQSCCNRAGSIYVHTWMML